MNTKRAKQLDFPFLLSKLGYHPVRGGIKKGGAEIWYQSPFNSRDKTASFHISKGRSVAWVFKCFSTGEQGTIIDFVIAHERYAQNDIKAALSFLRTIFKGALLDYKEKKYQNSLRNNFSSTNVYTASFEVQTDRLCGGQSAERQLEFIKDLPLLSGKLIGYLEKDRKIPKDIAQKYLRLVRYRNTKNQKEYFGIGIKNRAGGFEVRAASGTYNFKSVLGARDISVLKGEGDQDRVLVFEGMMDCLSYMVMQNKNQLKYDSIIMHSVNTYAKCKGYIQENQYRQILTYLDNDQSGEKCKKRFSKEFGYRHVDQSMRFYPHKDLNEALKEGFRSLPAKPQNPVVGISELS